MVTFTEQTVTFPWQGPAMANHLGLADDDYGIVTRSDGSVALYRYSVGLNVRPQWERAYFPKSAVYADLATVGLACRVIREASETPIWLLDAKASRSRFAGYHTLDPTDYDATRVDGLPSEPRLAIVMSGLANYATGVIGYASGLRKAEQTIRHYLRTEVARYSHPSANVGAVAFVELSADQLYGQLGLCWIGSGSDYPLAAYELGPRGGLARSI